ncbi:Major Facilitator Superfamily [Geosmithia morbida]|uniref:Major Facilitator Superfamily n=1 Tax=Geosmithia morbida TaxID=1094350 RepID=A0A9P5D7F8_9HYPO|nr:Major Facilitator Superfamily [Geosmithia morbida]KAF4125750.1 Major Facilitator Superfamily [Geosmithia morbida]
MKDTRDPGSLDAPALDHRTPHHDDSEVIAELTVVDDTHDDPVVARDGDDVDVEAKRQKEESVSWGDLPRKDQLVVITLARLSEPLVQTSLQAYVFYQLKWFDPSLPDSAISTHAGALHASFTAAQFVTAMLWGRVADSPRAGRKAVILVGLTGTSLSCLGIGFSTAFWQALVFRTLGGITNGNVGVMRTMISEIINEKKYQSRAFLLLPMTFNVGVIIGPILGGIMSDPAGSYPDVFGGIAFFEKYPYAAPNILSFVFLVFSAAGVWLCLEETLGSIAVAGSSGGDLGLRLGRGLASLLSRCLGRGPLRREGGHYTAVPTADHDNDESIEIDPAPAPAPDSDPAAANLKTRGGGRRFTNHLPFRRIFTRNVVLTLISHFFMSLHIGTFNSLWFVFLSTPVYDADRSSHATRLPFRFTGGLGLAPQSVGLAMATLGVIGITMQLVLYPRVAARLGTVVSWRLSLCCFPLAYFLVPYLSVVPSAAPPPEAKSGPAVWVALFCVLFIQVLGRTFALPAQTILINNCSPHPSVLGTVHGIGQSVSSGARTIGPMVGGLVYGLGLDAGVVGVVWWAMSAVAVLGFLASLFVREGDGHEIWLEGDQEET